MDMLVPDQIRDTYPSNLAERKNLVSKRSKAQEERPDTRENQPAEEANVLHKVEEVSPFMQLVLKTAEERKMRKQEQQKKKQVEADPQAEIYTGVRMITVKVSKSVDHSLYRKPAEIPKKIKEITTVNHQFRYTERAAPKKDSAREEEPECFTISDDEKNIYSTSGSGKSGFEARKKL